VKNLEKTVADYVPTHLITHPFVVHRSDGWQNRKYEQELPYSIDVRKTDSLVSPYIGTVEFKLYFYLADVHDTKEKAEKDTGFGSVATLRHRYTFAFQQDKWVLKLRESMCEIGAPSLARPD
jgi:hypothetical protein